MTQLQDRQVVYIDETDVDRHLPARYQSGAPWGHPVYVVRRPRRRKRTNWPLLFVTPFMLSFIAFVFLVFAVDDLTWLMTKLSFILAIAFAGGTVLTVIGGIGMAIYDTLFGRVDYYD